MVSSGEQGEHFHNALFNSISISWLSALKVWEFQQLGRRFWKFLTHNSNVFVFCERFINFKGIISGLENAEFPLAPFLPQGRVTPKNVPINHHKITLKIQIPFNKFPIPCVLRFLGFMISSGEQGEHFHNPLSNSITISWLSALKAWHSNSLEEDSGKVLGS